MRNLMPRSIIRKPSIKKSIIAIITGGATRAVKESTSISVLDILSNF